MTLKSKNDINIITKLKAVHQQCTGCSACANACPKDAITMCEDQEGFLYPDVNSDLCLNCGICLSSCQCYEKIDLKEPTISYAAINKNMNTVLNSSSGGIFRALAEVILSNGGVICGCSYEDDGVVRHILIHDIGQLEKAQRSKYVQSNMNDIYKHIMTLLIKGTPILFSGTPCQVAGLKLFLRKEYNLLFCIDIICHGVQSQKLLKKTLELEYPGCSIKELRFRDKRFGGWGVNGSITFTRRLVEKTKRYDSKTNYYYNAFCAGKIFRKSCYYCKYAQASRDGDITLGDFWGAGEIYTLLASQYGISAVMVNTEKGRKLLREAQDKLEMVVVNYEEIKKGNTSLNHPSEWNSERNSIYKAMQGNTLNKYERDFRKNNYGTIWRLKLRDKVPYWAIQAFHDVKARVVEKR